MTSDGTTYAEQTTYCDGSTAVIVANLYCYVPMSVLAASPYNLPFEAYVVTKARAKNSIGWGSYSSTNSLVTQIE